MKFLDFLLNALAIGITFLYGSTGEIITEKAGHLNLGIPGIMGVGAACGCAALNVLCSTGTVPPALIVILGILAALAGGAAIFGLNYGILLLKHEMGNGFNTALSFLLVIALIVWAIRALNK